MKITTKQEDTDTSRIHVDGKPTEFCIVRGEDPKFGMRREWDLQIGGDLGFVGHSKADVLKAFKRIWIAARAFE